MAPLTEIVAFFEKKIQGAFWRFSGQKRALSDSKHLATLEFSYFIFLHAAEDVTAAQFTKFKKYMKFNHVFSKK